VQAPPPAPKPPVPLKGIVVNGGTGELEWEIEVLEEGELEWEGEVFEGGELFGPNGELARFLNLRRGNEGVAFDARAKHTKKCKKGFVRKGRKCVNNAPVKYGRVHLAVTPGHYKLRIKPNKTVLNALKKGRKLRVKTTLTFAPTRFKTTHLTQTSSTTVHLTKKHKKKHHHK
jgi:hypothetical protein